MSHFECPCGQQFDIFGKGGAQKAALELGVDFLGQLPFVPDVRIMSDAGKPVVVSKPESNVSKTFGEIATKIIQKLEAIDKVPTKKIPKIVLE